MNERKPEQGMSAHLAPGGLRQNIRSFPVLSVRWRKKKNNFNGQSKNVSKSRKYRNKHN